MDPDLGYWYIISKINSRNRVWKEPLQTIVLGVEISCKACLPVNIFSGDLHFDALIIRLCWIFLIIGGKWTGWRRGLSWRTEGRRKLCMVSCHSCYICESKEVGRGNFIGWKETDPQSLFWDSSQNSGAIIVTLYHRLWEMFLLMFLLNVAKYFLI